MGKYDPISYNARKDRRAAHPVLRTPHSRLRDLLVDMNPPQFDSTKVSEDIFMFAPEAVDRGKYLSALKILRNQKDTSVDITYIHGIAFYRGCLPFDLLQEFGALNADQRSAVAKILTAQDYLLLLGMPGTGKMCVFCFLNGIFSQTWRGV